MFLFQSIIFILLAIFILIALISALKLILGWIGLMVLIGLSSTAFIFFSIISQGNNIKS